MSQLDLFTAQSIAAERTRTTRRDADYRRLARERAELGITEPAVRHGHSGLLGWLHPTPAAHGTR